MCRFSENLGNINHLELWELIKVCAGIALPYCAGEILSSTLYKLLTAHVELWEFFWLTVECISITT
jgi:hypothetical protein